MYRSWRWCASSTSRRRGDTVAFVNEAPRVYAAAVVPDIARSAPDPGALPRAVCRWGKGSAADRDESLFGGALGRVPRRRSRQHPRGPPVRRTSFGLQPCTDAPPGDVRIRYAGHLSPEKGIHTLLSMLYVDLIAEDAQLSFTVTTAGADKPQGKTIQRILTAHPGTNVVPARKTPASMASLMAEHPPSSCPQQPVLARELWDRIHRGPARWLPCGRLR
jgi:hypothetical protein